MSGTRLADEDKPIQTREKTMEMGNQGFIEMMLENSEPEATIPLLRVEGVEGVVHEQQIHKLETNGWVQYCVFTIVALPPNDKIFKGAFHSFQDALEHAISPQRSLIKSLYKQQKFDAQYAMETNRRFSKSIAKIKK